MDWNVAEVQHCGKHAEDAVSLSAGDADCREPVDCVLEGSGSLICYGNIGALRGESSVERVVYAPSWLLGGLGSRRAACEEIVVCGLVYPSMRTYIYQ